MGTGLIAAESKEVVHFILPGANNAAPKMFHVPEEILELDPAPLLDVGMSGTAGLIGEQTGGGIRCDIGEDGDLRVFIVEESVKWPRLVTAVEDYEPGRNTGNSPASLFSAGDS